MSGIESAFIGKYLCEGDSIFPSLDFSKVQIHAGIQILGKKDWLEYVERTLESMVNANLLAIWDGACYLQCADMYDYMQTFYPFVHTIPAHALEPYLYMYQDEEGLTSNGAYDFEACWQDQRVLVITSHGDSVNGQIASGNVDVIFGKHRIFSKTTTIQVYKCTQQNGANGDGYGWKGHFLKMCHDISQYTFDVALIGCGGFSNLLGHYIHKELGRSAVYVGGPIQLFFGVMGRRWMQHPRILGFLRRHGDAWIEPVRSDKPLRPGCVEEGCYWL